MQISYFQWFFVIFLVLHIALYENFVSGSHQLVVKPVGNEFTRSEKSSMVLTCGVTGDKNTTISVDLKWFHDKTEITDKTTRRYVEEESPTEKKLYITEFEEKDEGPYRCEGEIDGILQQKTVNLNLFKEITFDYAPEFQHPAIHTDALIACRVSGRPEPTISWKYNNDRILTGGRYTISKEDGLHIKNITLADNGNYTCRAEVDNDGRYNEKRLRVEVHIPPKITEGLKSLEGIEGGEATIRCQAEGLPDPTYKFFKDSSTTALVSSDRVKIDSVTGTVVFQPLKKQDEGKYTCLAGNDVGNQTSEGMIKVLVKPDIYEFENKVAKEGDIVALTCSSHGDPIPNMTIVKVGNESYIVGSSEGDDPRIVVKTDSTIGQLTLTFNSLIIEDEGDYRCRAGSDIGSDEKLAKVDVQYSPRFPSSHPKWVYIWAGMTRNITCNVDGDPVPTMEWLRRTTTISNNNTFSIFTSGLQSNLQVRVMEADQPWIYGTYICKASNDFGIQEIEIELRRAIVPDAPRTVNVTERLPDAIYLYVEPPVNDGGEKIIGYRAEYFAKTKIQNSSVLIEDEVIDQEPEYTQILSHVEVEDSHVIKIENLKPNTTYVIRVKARNAVGLGTPTEVTVDTEYVRQPNPIQITSGSEAEAYTYLITWMKPLTGGRPILKYNFRYREVIPPENDSGEKKYGPWIERDCSDDPEHPRLTFQLDSLSPKTSYQLEVKAQNDVGWSEYSEFQFQTREPSAEEVASMHAASVSPGAIVGIVFVIFIVLLVIVDVSCYFFKNCGVTMCICVHLCGQNAAFAKEKTMEEGERQCLKSDDDKDTQKEKEELKEALKEGIEPEKEKPEVKIVGDTSKDAEKSEKAHAV